MAIRNEKLGGVDWGEEDLKPTIDLNPTINAVIDIGANGQAVNANKILKAVGAYENGYYSAAENYTIAAGIKGTVNTIDTTSVFVTNAYNLSYNSVIPGQGDSNNALIANVTGSTGLSSFWGVYGTMLTGSFLKTMQKQSGDGATRAVLYASDGTTLLASANFVGDVATFSPEPFLEIGTEYWFCADNNGSAWSGFRNTSVVDDFTDTSNLNLQGGIQGGAKSGQSGSIITITTETASYNTSSKIECDSNTITLDGTENAIIVYSDQDTPTDTSMTLEISDGTTTLLSAIPITNKTTGVQGLNGVSPGTLHLTFNQNTTNTSVTPIQRGWGVILWRQ